MCCMMCPGHIEQSSSIMVRQGSLVAKICLEIICTLHCLSPRLVNFFFLFQILFTMILYLSCYDDHAILKQFDPYNSILYIYIFSKGKHSIFPLSASAICLALTYFSTYIIYHKFPTITTPEFCYEYFIYQPKYAMQLCNMLMIIWQIIFSSLK